MSDSLRQMWGLDEAPAAASSAQAEQFHREFTQAIAPANAALGGTAAEASQAEHAALDRQRAKLYTAYQATLRRIDPTNPAAAERDISRVLAAANQLGGRARTLADQSGALSQEWSQHEAEFDELVDHVGELEAADHPKAPAMRQLVDAIRTRSNDHDYRNSLTALNQVRPKVEGIYQRHQQQSQDGAAGDRQAGEAATAPRAEAEPSRAPSTTPDESAPATRSTGREAVDAPSRDAGAGDVDVQEGYAGSSVASSAAAPATAARAPAADVPSDEDSQATPRGATPAADKTPLEERLPEERAAVQAEPDDTQTTAAQDADRPLCDVCEPEEEAQTASTPAADVTENDFIGDGPQRPAESSAGADRGAATDLQEAEPRDGGAADEGPDVTENDLRRDTSVQRATAEVSETQDAAAEDDEIVGSAEYAESDTLGGKRRTAQQPPDACVTPPPGATEEEEIRQDTGAVAFTVRDRATEQAIEGATVRLGDRVDGRGVTGPDGTCTIDLPAGSYACRVHSAEHHEHSQTVEVIASVTSPLFVRLERAMPVQGGSGAGDSTPSQGTPRREPMADDAAESAQEPRLGAVAFTVRDRATEQAIAGASVRLGDSVDGRGVTGSGGTCTLQQPAGSYSCRVSSAEYHEYSETVEVVPDVTSPLFVRLERAASVEQTQADESTPSQGVPQREPATAATPEATEPAAPAGQRLTQQDRDQMHTDIDSIEEELERLRSERNLSWTS